MGTSTSSSNSSNSSRSSTNATGSVSNSTGVSSSSGFSRARSRREDHPVNPSPVLPNVWIPKNTGNESWRETIRQKLNDELENNPNLLLEIEKNLGFDLEAFITVLGDPNVFCEAFLQPQYDYHAVQRELQEERKFFEENHLLVSEVELAFQRMEARRKAARDLEIKFVLTSCLVSGNWLVRSIANLARFDFGALHACLMVDGTLLEWGRGKCGNSLIVPILDPAGLLFAVDIQNQTYWKKFKSIIWNAVDIITFGWASYIYAQIAFWTLGTANEQQLRKMAEVCTNFNRYKKYDAFQTNCQTFVVSLCKELELLLRFDGEMSRFVDRLLKDGHSDFIFRSKTFKTRQELDEYVMHGVDFQHLSVDDQKLLFAYVHVMDEYQNALLKKEECAERKVTTWQTSEKARRFWAELAEKQRWSA